MSKKAKLQHPLMPSEVPEQLSLFDRFATKVAKIASQAWFFAFCAFLVIIWAPSILILQDIDTWQLIINTVTTIITFLLVALLQNTQERSDLAVQHKLNAIADALSDLMLKEGLDKDAKELKQAVGLEDKEGSDQG